MHRRQFLNTAALTTATLALTSLSAQAQTATSTDERGTLPERLGATAPEILLEALLTTPVTTPLTPRDTPEVEPVPWEDESDTDLQGAIGGVLFQTGWDANDNPLVMSTAIVMPDADSATSSLEDINPAQVQELYGLPFIAQDFGDYAVAVVRVGYLLLAGGAEPPEDPIGNGSSPGFGATPDAVRGSGRHHLRALANLAATLDHVEDVLATLNA